MTMIKKDDVVSVDATRRVLGAVRSLQSKDHWLQKRASEKLGLNYRTLLRLDRDLSRRKPEYMLTKASLPDLSGEQRWAVAYRIRKCNVLYAEKICKAIAAESGLPDPEAMSLVTVCKNEMWATDADERDWALYRKKKMDEVLPTFDGDLSVIVEMESYPKFEVDYVLDWLQASGCCRVFDEVDGHMSRFVWEGDDWVEIPYPIVRARWETDDPDHELRRMPLGDADNPGLL